VLRGSVKAGVAGTFLALVLPASAFAASGAGGAPASDDAATSIYVEHVPAAGGTPGEERNRAAASDDAATSIYVEPPPGTPGTAGLSNRASGAKSLEQLLTSPTLGAPQRVQPLPGDTDAAYGTFSFQTVREVAGVGTARLAGLLAALALIALTLGAAALSKR
jgi:hypothetical protein